MRYTGERVVPWNLSVGPYILQSHALRYAWAVPLVYGRYVVDLGCGCGYGAFLLSWGACQAIGIDVDGEAITFANAHYKADNLYFQVADVTTVDMHADVYVAFEVLEHLDEPGVVIERFRPLIWSIPVNDGSRFHKRPYNVAQIDQLTDGTGCWVQSLDGMIVERGREWFDPATVIGCLT